MHSLHSTAIPAHFLNSSCLHFSLSLRVHRPSCVRAVRPTWPVTSPEPTLSLYKLQNCLSPSWCSGSTSKGGGGGGGGVHALMTFTKYMSVAGTLMVVVQS